MLFKYLLFFPFSSLVVFWLFSSLFYFYFAFELLLVLVLFGGLWPGSALAPPLSVLSPVCYPGGLVRLFVYSSPSMVLLVPPCLTLHVFVLVCSVLCRM